VLLAVLASLGVFSADALKALDGLSKWAFTFAFIAIGIDFRRRRRCYRTLCQHENGYLTNDYQTVFQEVGLVTRGVRGSP